MEQQLQQGGGGGGGGSERVTPSTDAALTMTTLRVGGVPEHFNLPWMIAIGNTISQCSLSCVHYDF